MSVKRGVTRTVILTRRWAIKVPSLRGGSTKGRARLWALTSGIQANLSEVEWSGWSGVCPVVFSLAGLVNVYPRAEPIAAIDQYPPGPPVLDRKPENLGILAGRLVWLDYDQSQGECQACRRYAYETGVGA